MESDGGEIETDNAVISKGYWGGVSTAEFFGWTNADVKKRVEVCGSRCGVTPRRQSKNELSRLASSAIRQWLKIEGAGIH